MTQNLDLQAEIERSDLRSERIPLVVDLDGTLLRTDLLLESRRCA